MQVIQTSVLLKYRSLFSFLQRKAPSVGQEIQRSYVGAARVYFETGFRRYSRSLGWIKVRLLCGWRSCKTNFICKARTVEKLESIVAAAAVTDNDGNTDAQRLVYANIDGPGVTLAYMADDKNHVCGIIVSTMI
jgi:vacuolar protein sorting-associated protein 52